MKKIKMKSIISLCVILAICLVPSFSFATDSNLNKENGVNEIKINERLDELIAGIGNSELKEELIKYFYLPAYSKTTVCDNDREAEQMIENVVENSDENYRLALHLISLDKQTFDKEIEKLICDGAYKISRMSNITVEEDYLDYVRPYVDRGIVEKLESKNEKNSGTVAEIFADGNNLKATKKSKVFMKEYGSSTTAAYTMFKIKATWSYNTSEITSLKTSGQQIVTPWHIQTFSARSKTTHSQAYGYVQRAWGYTNALYGNGQVVGYYIIDVKLKKGTVAKEYLETISTNMWNNYSWG